jgi:hypothetical protein
MGVCANHWHAGDCPRAWCTAAQTGINIGSGVGSWILCCWGDSSNNSATPTTSTAPDSIPDPAPASSSEVAPTRPHTRLQGGIRKPKIYIDGTIKYSFLATFEEPHNLEDALGDKNWKQAMDEEFGALVKNKTWHLVPPSARQ